MKMNSAEYQGQKRVLCRWRRWMMVRNVGYESCRPRASVATNSIFISQVCLNKTFIFNSGPLLIILSVMNFMLEISLSNSIERTSKGELNLSVRTINFSIKIFLVNSSKVICLNKRNSVEFSESSFETIKEV